jgi:hypothetical protein
MLRGKVARRALGLPVDNEVDLALPVQHHATRTKPNFSNSGSSVLGVGEANSTNSNPINPMGFSNRSDIQILLKVKRLTQARQALQADSAVDRAGLQGANQQG